ncbi:ribonuclease HII [Agromyces seonyuensis]|uniref:Ribonuclease n=1 Tax=Agromyces seonyuensis TaxID=2662446 RepID=A0A6I4NW26_9MICO|nr:ribonuclease HII [Agromyces seonyuensis]MWB98301.1 ribonuclease HII [Agromyces seonyuensis]
MAVVLPTLEVEQAFFASGCPAVIGVDEVGRGAIAGPVTVGVVLLEAGVAEWPEGLRDSKLLSEPRRELLDPLVREWAVRHAVGEATPREVDELGIVTGLGLAAARAVAALLAVAPAPAGTVILLDGSHDWLTPAIAGGPGAGMPVTVRPKADRDCVAVAAASVIAKVHRDRAMRAAHEAEPHYGWDGNKGYGSAAHLAAIAESGLSHLHRATWVKSSVPAPLF